MAKVFVVNDAGFPYELASEYGELVILTSGVVNVRKNPESIKEKLSNILRKSSPEDYLLLSGSNLLCVMAFDFWIHRASNDAPPINKTLHWNKGARRYDLYTF